MGQNGRNQKNSEIKKPRIKCTELKKSAKVQLDFSNSSNDDSQLELSPVFHPEAKPSKKPNPWLSDDSSTSPDVKYSDDSIVSPLVKSSNNSSDSDIQILNT